MAEPLLDVHDVSVRFRRPFHAPVLGLDGVSLSLEEGRTRAIVGESGSGKTTLARVILGLQPVTAGTVRIGGVDVAAGRRAGVQLARLRQAVFQDPFGSLNPARTILTSLAEPLAVQERMSRADVHARAAEMIRRVGLPGDALERYPAEFSGGQRQRIAIARALMTSPRLIVCDEAVSALDLSVQAQILNLLAELQRDLGVAYLFISHDLAVVEHFADDVTVLYRGVVVEQGPARQVCTEPREDYTRRLVASGDPDAVRARLLAEAAHDAAAGMV